MSGSRDGPSQPARRQPVRTLARWGQWARAAVSGAGPERDTALQALKAATATVLAWQAAEHLLDSPTPFYAPLAALLVVDRTMVRSLGASAQRVAAVVVGMSVAWLVGTLVGVSWWSMVAVMLLALAIGQWRRLGDHGIQVPTMVLLSLLTVHGTDAQFTYLTILETLVGGVIGVATNAVVFAPLHIRRPRQEVQALTLRVHSLFSEMAAGLRAGWDADTARRWYESSREIMHSAPQVLDAIATGRESTRFNPRHDLRPARVDWSGYERAVETLGRSQWQVSGIARTLADAADDAAQQPAPSPGFLEGYAAVLDEIGAAVDHFGIRDDAQEQEVRVHLEAALAALDRLGGQAFGSTTAAADAWPAHGALIMDAQRLARDLMARSDEATVPTSSGPVRVPWSQRVPEVRDRILPGGR